MLWSILIGQLEIAKEKDSWCFLMGFLSILLLISTPVMSVKSLLIKHWKGSYWLTLSVVSLMLEQATMRNFRLEIINSLSL